MHTISKILLRTIAIYVAWLGISTPFRIENPWQIDVYCATMLLIMAFMIWLGTTKWTLNPDGWGLIRKKNQENKNEI